ncbi:unnamed protein product [Cylicocyclus nassatus]|uniref:Glucosylceramidase n=1 Tax=Cylicocyclus nassatus TaxID=53992 RepID=A0AA36M905_CYLNA|nr:unnamed protein product [Cylicocyclus nassatus]
MVFPCHSMKHKGIFWTITLIFLFQLVQADRPCAQRVYGINKSNIVCVCNATYCDNIQPLTSIQNGTAVVYVSSMAGKRFERTTVPLGTIVYSAPGNIKIEIDARQKFQSIIGFGGAFTDAAGINIASLGKQTQRTLLESYFGANALNII